MATCMPLAFFRASADATSNKASCRPLKDRIYKMLFTFIYIYYDL